ncbi:hypothetical protein [Blastococcus sp. CCUG 61487]|uniref:hypothetical protein n=1 Tax=Blastococcus sp. CCUG 61487 TaxID=1840703 RepID=UPI0010BF744B|nr:hypothetical protein [Blastococcus sp. CCUG 61487]
MFGTSNEIKQRKLVGKEAPLTTDSQVTIAVDVMGADHGPAEIVKGIRAALDHDPALLCIAVGTSAVVRQHILSIASPRLTYVIADEVITMDDNPISAVREKRQSSLLATLRLLKVGTADAAVTAANTGGTLVAAAAILRRIPNVKHPALATMISLPMSKPTVLVDCGGSVERIPEWLVQFASLGIVVARSLLRVQDPCVGLLANGTEVAKGDEVMAKAHRLLEGTLSQYRGFVEPDALFAPEPHVVVSDGLVGNIVVKTVEATFATLSPLIDRSRLSEPAEAVGASDAFDSSPKRIGWGGLILGIRGTVVKAHGTGTAENTFGALLLAASAHRARVTDELSNEFHVD